MESNEKILPYLIELTELKEEIDLIKRQDFIILMEAYFYAFIKENDHIFLSKVKNHIRLEDEGIMDSVTKNYIVLIGEVYFKNKLKYIYWSENET